jgi:DNA-directed RNA polymerase specialized sigma24 family protein
LNALQHSVTIHDERLYEVLSQLDETSLKVVILSFWINMSNRGIADELDLLLRDVNTIKQKAYAKMRKALEDKGHDAYSFSLRK